MNDTKISKLLSYALRHDPGSLGLQLDPQGWVDTRDLLAGLRTHDPSLTMEDVVRVVDQSDKKRFHISGDRIRASQGHTVEVDLQLREASPPPELYHGTSASSLESIRTQGLSRMARHHVHLSPNVETARRVGQRRAGEVVILRVDGQAMAAQGWKFWVSENGVWLVDAVPAEFIKVQE